jgi:hypothetical protein
MSHQSDADSLGGFALTTNEFPEFYARIMALRFPISVAEVLELRDLINHSADVYAEPEDLPQNREFRESLEAAIHSFGIENRHHSERLVRVLIMLRGMHFQHTIASRDAEQKLRQSQAENRTRRARDLRGGILAVLVMLGSSVAWIVANEPGLGIKLVALASAVAALGYFHALPRLDRETERVSVNLNAVLRKRVDTLNWRTLIHKLALLLGYKKIQGVEVFRHEQVEGVSGLRLLH